MTADKPRQPGSRKRKGPEGGPDAPDQATTRQPGREPRLVDVDPWAMMLEQLLGVPDEVDQSERAGGPGPARPTARVPPPSPPEVDRRARPPR